MVITGGTGLLGRPVVRLLLDQGRPVTLLVRNPGLLSEVLREAVVEGRVRIFVGDASDPSAVGRAVRGASYVLHMATCDGPDLQKVPEAMAQGVRIVGAAALDQVVRRLVFTSSTAALYQGGSRP